MGISEHFGLVRTSAPAVEPLDVDAEVKPWLRIDAGDTSQDTILSRLLAAARERCERVAGRALVTQTWRYALDRFNGWPFTESNPPSLSEQSWGSDLYRLGVDTDPRAIRLPRPPLQSVSSVTYVDPAGATQTLASSAYQVDTDSEPGRLLPAYATFWPVTRPQTGAVRITYVAGYGAAETSVPAEIRTALLACIGYQFREREAPDEEFLDSLFVPFAEWGHG